jgi:hypothetical protein
VKPFSPVDDFCLDDFSPPQQALKVQRGYIDDYCCENKHLRES